MGANASKSRYEYSRGDPSQYYNYANSWGGGYTQYHGQGGGTAFGGPAPVIPRAMGPQQPIIYPLIMQPMQQLSGPPLGQVQQNPYMQMSQPQMQAMSGNPYPPNPMPVPQMPQPGVQPSEQPQPQRPFSPDQRSGMPEPTMGNGRLGPGRPGATPVIPRSLARAPESLSTSTGSSPSSSSSGTATFDPLARNPLPAPPREAETPADMLAGSAMAHTLPLPRRSSGPLKNPLPSPPRDVYTLRKYRPLLVGTAYADRKGEVYPEGWFSEERRQDREGGLGRVFERLNPFRSPRGSDYSSGHRRYDTMPELPRLPEFMRENSSGSDTSLASQGARRRGLGGAFTSRLPFGRRRRDDVPMIPPRPIDGLPPVAGSQPPAGFMPMPSPVVPGPQSHPQPQHPLSPMPPQPQGPQATQPFSPMPPQPQGPQPMQSFSPMPPQPQVGNPLTPGPVLTRGTPMPTPARALSPLPIPRVAAGQGPGSSISESTSSELRFNAETPGYGGLSHLSPHRVLYKKKLYPTAAHLFEAHRFLGRHNDLARRVRKTRDLADLDGLLRSLEAYTRPDWEEVLLDKMEDALYHKLRQHGDLCDLLLDTRDAEIIYAEPSDPFWGEGEHEEGANELGRALMRIRDRLRQEAENN